MNAHAMAQDLIGVTLGRVRLEERIGEGAVGAVYRGRHTGLGIDVAVKVLKQDGQSDPAYRERFRREARLAARLEHPGLVRVIDFGFEEGHLFLVMDMVEGFSLDRFLKRRGHQVDEITALKLLLAIALPLQVAHDANVIHRDLKPANIMISRQGKLKVTDLGLAREEGLPGLTQDRIRVGSPAYMSPEALNSGMEVDHRTDIYALGVIGYELVFGCLPYGPDIQDTIRGHLAGNARWDRPTPFSKPVVTLVQRLMAHRREERYQTISAAIADIRKLFSQAQRRQTKMAPRNQPSGSSGSRSSVSGSGSDFSGFGSFLESRLGTYASDHDGGQVIHTTLRERFFVWVLLAALVALLALGYWQFG